MKHTTLAINVHALFILIIILLAFHPNKNIFAQQNNTDEFVIGVANDYLSIDPHLIRASPPIQLAHHMYDTLFFLNEKGRYRTRILADYKIKNKTTWILTLKDNIYFHDGSPLTTDDIIYSFDRINNIPDSEYTDLTKRIKSYKKIGALTLEIITHSPHPTLTRDLSLLFILKQRSGFIAGEEFIKNKGFIGTGPYQFVQLNDDKSIILKASDHYHGTPVYQKKIKYVVIENTEERLKAFKEGKLHLIDNLTSTEVEKLNTLTEADFLKIPTSRLLYLHFDTYRESSPWVTDYKGNVLPKNPFRDLKVRQAISHAINREAIISEILNGAGVASGQFVLPKIHGYDPSLQPDQYDLKRAQKLMSDAGYAEGFQMTLHGPKHRYLKDVEVMNRIVEMLKAINIHVKLDIKPMKQYLKTIQALATCCYLTGVSTGGDLKGMVSMIVRSPNKTLGKFNYGRYSNDQVNTLVDKGVLDFNEVRRLSTFRQAAEIAIQELAITPLYFQTKIWAIRNDMGIKFWPEGPGGSEKTLAQYIIKAQ